MGLINAGNSPPLDHVLYWIELHLIKSPDQIAGYLWCSNYWHASRGELRLIMESSAGLLPLPGYNQGNTNIGVKVTINLQIWIADGLELIKSIRTQCSFDLIETR